MEIIVNLNHALKITAFVFVIMMLVDYIEILTRGKMSEMIKGSYFRQYVITCALSSTPGCQGPIMNVSLYVHGLLTFGAIVGSTLVACGDEAFVMLALFPKKALMLFGILFILGIISAFLVDKIVPLLKIKPNQVCNLSEPHLEKECRIFGVKDIVEHFRKITLIRFLLLMLFLIFIFDALGGITWSKESNGERVLFILSSFLAIFITITVPNHYLKEHIWRHILKRHMWQVFLWTFFTLLVVEVGLKFWDLEDLTKTHKVWLLFVACLVGIIPQSGPHLIFVMMFAKGFIPFSVLIANSIVQDGHGMLPLLSYSRKDFLVINMIKFIIGLSCGSILYLLGV